jgi:hypothetical protein
VNEDTVIRYMPLPPHTRPWRWYADANLVVLCSSLDEDGQQAALSELQTHWRRKCLRVIPDEPTTSTQPITCPELPMTQLPAGLLTAER